MRCGKKKKKPIHLDKIGEGGDMRRVNENAFSQFERAGECLEKGQL